MQEELKISDILPKDWFDKNGNSKIYVSCYHSLTDILIREKKWYITGSILNAKFLLIDTVLEYHKLEFFFQKVVNSIPEFEMKSEPKTTEQGSILFLFLYYDDNESNALAELQSARGLLSNTEGKNTNYWHIADYILHLPKGEKTYFSPAIKGPDSCSAFTNEINVETISDKIRLLNINIQSRIKLALRWVDSAEQESNGIDEFLKLWFAIETISMPTTDIKPLISILAKVYHMDQNIAKDYFGIGRIFGLRSNIVHNGYIAVIHQQLIVFLKAIFNDVLLQICGVPSNKKAQQVLEDPTFNKTLWLP